jgi:hypothetical protein
LRIDRSHRPDQDPDLQVGIGSDRGLQQVTEAFTGQTGLQQDVGIEVPPDDEDRIARLTQGFSKSGEIILTVDEKRDGVRLALKGEGCLRMAM